MKTAIFTLSALLAGPVFADTIGAHLGTYHKGTDCVISKNPGVYVEHDGVVGGVYRNSCGRLTVHAGIATPEFRGASVVVAVATGYDDGLRFAAFPSYRASITRDYSVRASGGAWAGMTVVHISIERKF